MKSPEGRDQISNVQRLKNLILDQMQVLETALNLHGRLAPQIMQPLQERLIESFKKLRENLICLEKMKRQTSEIVNTPLPPLPHQMSLPVHRSTAHYELDDIYTPVVNEAVKSLNGIGGGNREILTLPDFGVVEPAPPVPSRNRSNDYIYTNSPEVPPKRDSNAPPLPPRGYTPDKRTMFIFGEPNEPPNAPNLPKRRVPYSVVDISLDDSEMDFQPPQQDVEKTYEEVLKRDSGISTSSGNLHQNDMNGGGDTNSNSLPHQHHTHTYPLVTHSHSHLHHSHLPQNIRGHHKTSSNPEVLAQIAQMAAMAPQDFIEMTVTTIQTSTIVRTQINSNENLEKVPSDPPPIPPKNVGIPPSGSYFDDDCSSTSSFPLPPIPQKPREPDEIEDEEVAMYDNFCVIKNGNGNINNDDDCSTCDGSDDGKVIIC